jgi:capsid portal protein
MALPPYMISPKDLKDKLGKKLCATLQKHPEQFYNETFPSYCAYSVASSKFTEELIAASECVEQLVGVDNPEKWLLLNS